MIAMIPPEWQLLGFFCKEPDVRIPEDIYFEFSVEITPNLMISVSIDAITASVEVKIQADGEVIGSLYRENLEKISIVGNLLLCEFYDRQMKSFLKIDRDKNFSFSFTELKVAD